jgi:hypothetical protein
MSASFPKQCACGRVYTLYTWFKLRYVGRYEDPVSIGGVGWLEMRNCDCGSTIVVLEEEVKRAPNDPG